MTGPRSIRILLVYCVIVPSLTRGAFSAEIEFNRDIRPILADTCLQCHGPDAETREADLRLDLRKSVLEQRGESHVIVPGHPAQSELIARITSPDPDLRMPPNDSERQLTPAQIELLRKWIEEGAKYEDHWAFLPIESPAVPEVDSRFSIHNPIDNFVLRRLQHEQIEPSPRANKATLIRRVSFDLTGLPPTPEEVDAFLKDESAEAYERAVDRLLDSPRYGERMALVWLDAARFADSGGYQGDILRSMWLWRDWVIDAYNENKPFDEFTIEQLAGDLLPEPTQAQLIATGFNRNHRINDEDGIVFEEFRVEYVADRVETTATVWLGLTMNCARCHDHKYDPLLQEDYYRFYAFFNSIDESGRGRGNAKPLLYVPTPAQQTHLDELTMQLEAQQAALEMLKATSAADAKDDLDAKQKSLTEEIAKLEKERETYRDSIPNLMVMQELPEPRQTHILIRGAYNQFGSEVIPGRPKSLSVESEIPLTNRLDLARWLVSPDNPLTARVAVNRYWRMYFGRGLVETLEDFGTQGSLPTHPDLLDWLAAKFVNSGWNVKQMQRLIVTSATYCQSSAGREELQERDPENKLLARSSRFRLDAEAIRDQALFASGLLVEQRGGPSVKPYQPAGLWEELASAHPKYVEATGDDLYRRSLYTFLRRTIPSPAMTSLDAPNREICTVRRARTNTPLQALGLMNDRTFVEAARALASRTIRESPDSTDAQLIRAFRLILARKPTKEELDILQSSLAYFQKRFAADPDAAEKLISVGESKPDATLDSADVAALTSVCLTILNLDETLTRE